MGVWRKIKTSQIDLKVVRITRSASWLKSEPIKIKKQELKRLKTNNIKKWKTNET